MRETQHDETCLQVTRDLLCASVGGNQKGSMTAKQNTVTALCLLCSWYKNKIISNGCRCQLTRALFCEK